MSYQDDLGVELALPQYAGLMDSARRNVELAAAMNYRDRTGEANPDPQDTIFKAPVSASEFLSFVDTVSAAGLFDVQLTNALTLAWPTKQAECQRVMDFLDGESPTICDSVVLTITTILNAGENVQELLTDLVLILQDASFLTGADVSALAAAFLTDDPAWVDTIYTYAPSIAMKRGWPEVTTEAVDLALA